MENQMKINYPTKSFQYLQVLHNQIIRIRNSKILNKNKNKSKMIMNNKNNNNNKKNRKMRVK